MSVMVGWVLNTQLTSVMTVICILCVCIYVFVYECMGEFA